MSKKKVYEPGEMLRLAYWPDGGPGWRDLRVEAKGVWARAEKSFFDLLSEQVKADEVDEQTDDSCGIVTL
jgi:hypothetical protein